MDMNSRMNLDIFKSKIDNEITEAIQYKNKFVPNTLYKYVPLLDDRYLDYEEKNQEKITSLKNNKLWISHYKTFNDPFEFKTMIIDMERLQDKGWKYEEIEKYLDFFRNLIFTSCFTSEVDNNMPMWAHYANNHKGYCIKYEVLNANRIYPVSYEPKRIKSAVILSNLINEMIRMYSQKLKSLTRSFRESFLYFYLSLSCKHSFWSYEKEYRFLDLSIDLNNNNGKLIDLSEAGIKISAIYIGYNCDENYISKLINVGKYIGCEVYKMEFDEYEEEFKLKPVRVI